MGCNSSQINSRPNRRASSISTESKVNQALKRKIEENKSQIPLTFDKVLLKFHKISVTLGYVKKVFNKMAKNGKLDHPGLEATMQRLDVHMDLGEILSLFDFVDLECDDSITMKEFFVALTVGVALDAIPAFSSTPSINANANINTNTNTNTDVSEDGRPVMQRQFSTIVGHEKEIKETLNLVISTYLLFDPEGRGYIDKKHVISIVDENKHKSGSNAMLSQERWQEMDWDENGQIDFAEFVYSFTTWVDNVEDDEDDP